MADFLFDALLWYMVFIFSLTCHEAAHAFAAMKLGDKTAYYGGQVTLDPRPHMVREPFGTIVIPFLSFFLAGWMMGWASAPYDPLWEQRYPKRAAWMAFAGPAANFSLVVFSAILIRVGLFAGLFQFPDSLSFMSVVSAPAESLMRPLAILLSVMFYLNLILFVFNLIPLPPLDGSGILPLIINEEKALRYKEVMRNPVFSIVGLFIAWNIFDVLFYPVNMLAINLLFLGV